MPSRSRISISRSKICSQSLLRAKLSSVMKKRRSPCFAFVAHDPLDVVGGAAPRLAALHVDDGAEGALEGAAAAGVEAGVGAEGAPHHVVRQMRDRHPLDARQVGHEIVDRLQLPGERVAQDLVEPAFLGLAGEDEGAEVERLLHVRLDPRQHGKRAGDVEAADADRDAFLAEGGGQVERARELVRLHADQHHHAGAGLADRAGDAAGMDAPVGLVDGDDFERRCRARARCRSAQSTASP